MIKSFFRLAIVLLIVHALFRFVPPYWNHTRFESELKDRALTWREHTSDEVRAEVLRLAHSHNVPIDREHVAVRREREHLFVNVRYTRPIELIPGGKYDWTFKSDVDAWMITPPVPVRR